MIAELRDQYENYKQRPFAVQVVRVSNTIFAVFTFWNVALQPDPVHGLSLVVEANPSFFLLTLFLGIILAALLLVRPPDRHHYLLLPVLAFGFFASSHRDSALGLALVPFASLAILGAVRVIICVANYLNRV